MVRYITQEQEELVKQKLLEGLSHRRIAAEVGMGKSTVERIARGTFKVKTRLPPTIEGEEVELLTGPIGRCPKCRAKVVLPCRACAIRKRYWPVLHERL